MPKREPEITVHHFYATPDDRYFVRLDITPHNPMCVSGHNKDYDLVDRCFFNGTGKPTSHCPTDIQQAIDAAVLEGLTAKTLIIYQTDSGGKKRQIAAEDFDAEDLIEVLKRSIASS